VQPYGECSGGMISHVRSSSGKLLRRLMSGSESVTPSTTSFLIVSADGRQSDSSSPSGISDTTSPHCVSDSVVVFVILLSPGLFSCP
jgi:hypothetical protein